MTPVTDIVLLDIYKPISKETFCTFIYNKLFFKYAEFNAAWQIKFYLKYCAFNATWQIKVT